MQLMERAPLKNPGTCAMEKRENDVYSEQNVKNILLRKYESTHGKDSFRDENQVEFCKGKKNRSRAIILACLSPELVCRAM